MLEIAILIVMCKRIGAIVRAKGHSAVGYQVLLVVLWFVGEIGGGFMGGIVAAILTQQGDLPMALAYLFALIGAVVGAVIALMVAKNLSSVSPDEDYRKFSPPPPLEQQVPGDYFQASKSASSNPGEPKRPPDERFHT